MAEMLLSLIIVAAALAGLGLGRLFGRSSLAGTCGGLAQHGACTCRDKPQKDATS